MLSMSSIVVYVCIVTSITDDINKDITTSGKYTNNITVDVIPECV